MTLCSRLAKNLYRARNKAGLTQEALARKARVSTSYVSMLERGERIPHLATLEILGKALKTDPLFLLA